MKSQMGDELLKSQKKQSHIVRYNVAIMRNNVASVRYKVAEA